MMTTLARTVHHFLHRIQARSYWNIAVYELIMLCCEASRTP